MATFVKYNTFVNDMANKVHDLVGTAGSGADTCKVILSNTAPNVSTHTVRADVTELSTANGYTSGGTTATNVGSSSSGTFTLSGTDIVFTASGGSVGPFRYAILYNDTPTSPADPLIAYWDYGSSITLADGETFTVDFGASILTLA
jgi:hypothetical protein